MQNKQVQLFILPYAGGSIASFKRLSDLVDGTVEVITVEYPGRGTRAKEMFANSIWELLDDAIKYCNMQRDESVPYAVMGYSMGSIIAYEMLARKSIPGVLKHLFISAEVSPKERALELRQVDNPTEERVLKRIRKLGGFDERLLMNSRFKNIYVKPMLSDYRLFFEYRFSGYTEKIQADTTFFYCEEDTPYTEIMKWNELVEGTADFHEFGDNHFFINQHYEEMAQIINKNLRSEVMK